MSLPSIRFRLMAVLLLLVAMAVVEAAVVLYMQRESAQAIESAARMEMVLLDQTEAGRALDGMQQAYRGFLMTGLARELEEYEKQSALYERAVPIALASITDGELRTRFQRVVELADKWRGISREVIEQRMGGTDVTARSLSDAVPLFEALQAETGTYRRRQADVNQQAADLVRIRVRDATIVLTALPLLAVVFLLILLVAAERTILEPLAALTSSARRLAAGDYEATLSAVRDDEIGVLVGAFSEMRTAVQKRVSDAVLAQQRIRAAHAELLAVINTVPAALVIMNPDGSIRLQNRAAEHLLGKAPDTPKDRKKYWQTFSVRDAGHKPMRLRDIPPVRALSGVEIIGEEIDVQSANGRHTVILVGAAPLRDGQGLITGAVAGFQDITRLRELDRMKDEFVAIVSHELRTPLTAIRGSLQLLLADSTVTDLDSRQLLNVALKSCERLVRIINDMLDISKIEAGRLRLRRAVLPVDPLVGQAVDGMRTLASQAGVELSVDLEAGLPAIDGDADRVTQALVNLLSNAVKFAPRGSIVTVSVRATPDVVAFSVTNTGPRIAPDDIGRLFEKFQQLDDAGTRRAGGTGLGLSITKAIVEQHGGAISVESGTDRGTTFTFTIPRARSSPGPAVALVPPSRPVPASGGLRTVLVADDDAELRVVLRQMLARHGYRVIEAANGREAIEAASREPLDLVLLDLRLPLVHGHDVIRALRQNEATARIPIIVLSGIVGERHSLESLVLGANMFLTKPAEPEALVREINRLVGQKGAD